MANRLFLSTLPKTWILDLDGTICKHNGYKTDGHDTLLPDVKSFLDELPAEDRIIILTSRTEEYRAQTLRFLNEESIRYDEILFGMPYGERILVNDTKPSGLKTAYAIPAERDSFLMPEIERTDNPVQPVKESLDLGNKNAALKNHPLYINGQNIYEAIEKQRPEGYEVIIAPRHIGDTIWLSAFVRAFKEQHGNCRVILVVQESHKVLADCFPDVNNTIALTPIHLKSLEIYIEENDYWNRGHIRYGHLPFSFVLENDVLQYIQFPSKMPECVRTSLDLTDDAKPVRMTLPAYEESAELREMFGNAVLLMPGAISWKTSSVPADFWTRLANAFREKGIQVYTNHNGLECEFIVEGTEALSSTLHEMMVLSNYFRGFVGLRSGICDLIAETDAPLVCIYPRMTFDTGIEVSEEILSKDDVCYLGRTENIRNYQYDQTLEKELIRQIVEMF